MGNRPHSWGSKSLSTKVKKKNLVRILIAYQLLVRPGLFTPSLLISHEQQRGWLISSVNNELKGGLVFAVSSSYVIWSFRYNIVCHFLESKEALRILKKYLTSKMLLKNCCYCICVCPFGYFQLHSSNL